MKRASIWRVPLFTITLLGLLLSFKKTYDDERGKIAREIEVSIRTEMLNRWYPAAVDNEHGGFLSSFSYDWKPVGAQDKMIVTQARHTWSNAKAFQFFPDSPNYKTYARHGYEFLQNVLWDSTAGGFFTLVDRQGKPKQSGVAPKDAYGNAFAIYALAAYYQASGDTNGLHLAKEAFMWLEKHSHDPVYKGYHQHLALDGTPLKRTSTTPSTSDLGYKDQNSSIHLLEAFSELYSVWPDSLVRLRLEEMLSLVRDVITTDRGYLTLFFQPDWTPVSFSDSSEQVILRHRYLDHVSFGHDVETAYLMLEASHILGLKHDDKTMTVTKKMIDHSLRTGWDKKIGGFYDEGYYFKGRDTLSIIRDTKNWWAQAEGLNTLLLMADHFPSDSMNYFRKFQTQWEYIKTYLIDHEYGDWFAGGLDKEPDQKKAMKGHIWKGNYHQFRALSNCVMRLLPDKKSPSLPGNLTLQHATLKWKPSKDNGRILGYNIYTNGVKTGFTPLTQFAVGGVAGSERYAVTAVDLQGNESAKAVQK